MLEAKIFYFLNRQVVRKWVVFTTPHFPSWDHQQSSSNWDTVPLLTEQRTSPILVYDQLSKFVKQRQRKTFNTFIIVGAFDIMENSIPTVDGFYCRHQSPGLLGSACSQSQAQHR